jgi:sialate O-acetylesterase
MNDFGLSPLLSDGMIIQRDASFPLLFVKKVSVTFLGKTYEAQEEYDGKWLVMLESTEAGGPFTMEITDGSETVTINDIYAGDLWVCAGQSNMEMRLDRLKDNFSEEWEIEEYPVIRHFAVPQCWDFEKARDDITGGKWVQANADTLVEISAVGWFFAKELNKKQGVPIGLINTAWGGTPIEAWMNADDLSGFPEKIADGAQYADTARREGIIKGTEEAINEWEELVKQEDTGLKEGWERGETDISSWETVALPGDFKDAGVNDFCGAIWIAKDFEVEDASGFENAHVWLGTIVDADTVYINGTEVGNTTYRYPPRKYSFSGLLKTGTNRIAIKVVCRDGQGGVTPGKHFKIFSDNNTIELAGEWKYKIGYTAAQRPSEFFFHYKPMGDYNAMVAPLLKYPLKGVIWYQGESNTGNPLEYPELFKKMIQGWRERNVNEYLPFLFVQLPIFGEASDNNERSSWAIVREAQKSVLALPATGMACALELGEWNDLHPLNKKDVGYRLFLAAEKLLFLGDNTSPGPTLTRHEKTKDRLYLFFDNCGHGLKTETEEKAHVTVIDGSERFRLPAEIEGADFISIDISTLFAPERVLYAWADNPRDRQLYNSDGLPVIPFNVEI